MVSCLSMWAFNSTMWARTVVVDVAGPRAVDGNGVCGGTMLDATHGILAHWFIVDQCWHCGDKNHLCRYCTLPASKAELTAEREDADAGGVGVRRIHIIIEENVLLAKPSLQLARRHGLVGELKNTSSVSNLGTGRLAGGLSNDGSPATLHVCETPRIVDDQGGDPQRKVALHLGKERGPILGRHHQRHVDNACSNRHGPIIGLVVCMNAEWISTTVLVVAHTSSLDL